MSRVTAKEMTAFFKANFDGRDDDIPAFEYVQDGHVIMRMEVGSRHIRPGGYISGPTQMALADHAAYAVIFTRTGIVPMAVTSNLNIDFLRPCIGGALIADAKLIKLGKHLAVVSVEMRSDKSEKISSRATVTYVVPA